MVRPFTRRLFHSNVWIGGAAFVLATVAGAWGAGGGAVLATAGGVAVAAAAVRFASGPGRAARRALDRGAGCRIPHELAIAGPAVYPTTAPAAAPTGPNTTNPETAPRTALPPRSCACASNEINVPATAAATTSFFMAVSLNTPRHWNPKLRQHKGEPTAITSRRAFSGRGSIERHIGALIQLRSLAHWRALRRESWKRVGLST